MSSEITSRIDEVESRIAYLEHGMAQLDEVIRTAMRTLDDVQVELRALRGQIDVVSQRGDAVSERPPHYGS